MSIHPIKRTVQNNDRSNHKSSLVNSWALPGVANRSVGEEVQQQGWLKKAAAPTKAHPSTGNSSGKLLPAILGLHSLQTIYKNLRLSGQFCIPTTTTHRHNTHCPTDVYFSKSGILQVSTFPVGLLFISWVLSGGCWVGGSCHTAMLKARNGENLFCSLTWSKGLLRAYHELAKFCSTSFVWIDSALNWG